jgi:hypothetical protein
MPGQVALASYDAKVVARLDRDSAGQSRREQVETRALIVLQLARDSSGALRGSGHVDSFSVRGLENALSADASAAASATLNRVLFDAVLDASSARVTTRPVLANECDQPEAGATALVRELLIRIPTTLSVDDRWQDTTAAFICRSGIPITVRQRNSYRVERAVDVDGHAMLAVRRTIETALDGSIHTTWRTVDLMGTGHAEQLISVDAVLGSIAAIDGTSTLSLKVTDSARRDQARIQTVVQKVQLSIRKRAG